MNGPLRERARSLWQDYPHQYWVLFFGGLINSFGAGLVFPFLSLYLTKKLNFSMTEVGFSFGFFAVMAVISQVMGGVLADRWGRKPVMLVSLFGGAAGTLLLGINGLVDISQPWVRWGWVGLVVVVMGLTNGAYGPAVNAMIADLIEGPRRQQAYGLLRVVQNLGISIGPAIGGFIAGFSYFILFAVSAATAIVYGLILASMTHETRPQAASFNHPAAASLPVNATGFRFVFLDSPFISFCILIIVSQVVYSQMNTTLPVFLNKGFGVTELWYGLLMSLNAVLVVLVQFPITRKTSRYDKSLMMALGNGIFAIGFGMYGFVRVLPLFFLAQAIWTVGEMITVPVGQALVADFAPESMRGLYMGIYGVAYAIAYGIGPMLGGAVLDNLDGRYIWYGAIALDALVVIGFLAMRGVFSQRASQAAA